MTRDASHLPIFRAPMIGAAAEDALVRAVEQRLGQVVQVAATVHVRVISCPEGQMRPRTPEHTVIALSGDNLWLLELRDRAIAFSVGAALACLPRRGLVAHWRHRGWAWPTVWRLELSWPSLSTYIEGDLVSCNDTNKLMGLLAADDLDRALQHAPPAIG